MQDPVGVHTGSCMTNGTSNKCHQNLMAQKNDCAQRWVLPGAVRHRGIMGELVRRETPNREALGSTPVLAKFWFEFSQTGETYLWASVELKPQECNLIVQLWVSFVMQDPVHVQGRA